MSLRKLEEIRCPCGEAFEAELWSAINAAEDPELKEALECGEINVVCCPSCSEIFYAEHFLLYHDSTIELLAFVYPSSFAEQAAHWKTKMREDFERAREQTAPDQAFDYDPLLIFGLDSLVDLIHAEEEESDEVCILEYIAKDLGLSLLYLRPSLARPQQLPRLLPFVPAKNGDLREEIIEGIKRLLSHNEHLTHYQKLLRTIERNRDWKLDKNLLKQSPAAK
ncbi:MAG: CpXC domain-containing protein [Endomicrobiales bacterium]